MHPMGWSNKASWLSIGLAGMAGVVGGDSAAAGPAHAAGLSAAAGIAAVAAPSGVVRSAGTTGSAGMTEPAAARVARLAGPAEVAGSAGAAGSVGVAGLADTWRSRVSARLLSVYDSRTADRSAEADNRPSAADSDLAGMSPRFNDKGWVQADVHFDCTGDAPTKALISAGLAINSTVRLASFCVIEGWVAPQSLSEVAAVAGVTRVKVPGYAVIPRLRSPTMLPDSRPPQQQSADLAARPAANTAGGIDRNGVVIMRADQFVAQTRVNGAGAKVGVQSAGISSLNTIQARGELPSVQVVKPGDGANSQVGDEGTALLEEVHAVAPGAALGYCGPNTFVEYTSCLGQLIAAGATILVDDLIFPEQDLLSSDSPQVQAVEQLLADNPAVALFTAAGNYNGSYWEGSYTPVALSSLGLAPLTCPSNGVTQTDYYVSRFDADPSQLLTVTQASAVPIAFAWADPPDHNASRFDVYWVDAADSTKSGCLATAAATANQVARKVNLYSGTYTLYIATQDASAAGKFLKLWVGGDGLTSLSKPTNGGIVTSQGFAGGAVTVGAVNGSDGIGNGIEPFSSIGPITVAFPSLAHIQAPVLVAPDGITVDAAGTYFAGSLFPDGNFYGTSASAPNAAAVAALIRSAFPILSASQLISALNAGAVQLGSTSPDATFGYGRIDAMGALGTFPAPTMTSVPDSALMAGSSSPAYPFTVTGTGALHFTVTTSNTTSIPASIVAAGSPGVTIAPSDCGVTVLTCTLSVMPSNGPGGTVTVTVAAVDGANRSASASMTVTVTGTQAPPASSPPGPAPTARGGGGGKLEWGLNTALLLLAGLRLLEGRGPRRGSTELSGCTRVPPRRSSG